MQQLELFELDSEREQRLRHWRFSLYMWPERVWDWRHDRHTTGWSIACGSYAYARLLFRHGEITRKQFKRYWKFHRHIMRWHLHTIQFERRNA